MVMDGGGGTQAAHASEELVWQWKTESRPLSIQLFALNEPLLALRSSVLRAVGERAQLQSHLLEASRMARKAGHLAGAASVLHEVRRERERERASERERGLAVPCIPPSPLVAALRWPGS
jgi:hypothetical protein